MEPISQRKANWKYILIVLILAIIIGWGISAYCNYRIKKITSSLVEFPEIKKPKREFCGTSTYGSCASDSDCMATGCSGQVCWSKNEESIVTTCEWRECYRAKDYGFGCKCVDKKCQWAK